MRKRLGSVQELLFRHLYENNKDANRFIVCFRTEPALHLNTLNWPFFKLGQPCTKDYLVGTQFTNNDSVPYSHNNVVKKHDKSSLLVVTIIITLMIINKWVSIFVANGHYYYFNLT